MQLTPIRFVTCLLAVPLALVVGTGACGQVTGLSNDYVYDLQQDGGGSSSGDAKVDTGAMGDGAKTDAPADAPVGVDAATCSTAQASNTELRLTQLNGSDACKSCLAADCCNDVDSCLNITECRKALACRLNCTSTTAGTDRHDCYAVCNSNTGGNSTPLSYTSGVGACSASACAATTACAFQ